MDVRQEKGLQIAMMTPNAQTQVGWRVPSQSGNGSYIVSMEGKPFCTCPDFEKRLQPCKRILAVELFRQREDRPDGTTVVTKAAWVTYGQVTSNPPRPQ